MTLTPEDIAAGWVEWRGGDCPVPRSCLVDVKWSDGDCEIAEKAGLHKWHGPLPISKARLIAYRLHPAPVADEEKKL